MNARLSAKGVEMCCVRGKRGQEDLNKTHLLSLSLHHNIAFNVMLISVPNNKNRDSII